MSFEPQIPTWGTHFLDNFEDKLLVYHNWLSTTGIQTGLISPKPEQFIWDEFIVHSLYFSHLLDGFEQPEFSDLGTGGGIPGVPIAITSKKNISLIDVKESRINELERLVKILQIDNCTPTKADAIPYIKGGGNFVSRCYISTEDALNYLKKVKNSIYLVSSNENVSNYDKDVFHVKHEEFLINKTDLRHIDVITVV